MDSRQAKEILKLYRQGVDDSDPQFTEALAQARRDPELARWLEQQTAFDAAIRAKLKSVPIPLGLKTRILANAKAPRPVPWWRSPSWLAAAAIVVALLSVAVFWVKPQAGRSLDLYRAKMVAFVASDYKLDIHADKFDEIRQILMRNAFPSIDALPPKLTTLKLEGGCLLNWHGDKVTLICLEAKEEHDVWLFVAKRATLPSAAAQAKPQFAKVGKMITATWTTDDTVLMLVTEGDEAELKKYL